MQLDRYAPLRRVAVLTALFAVSFVSCSDDDDAEPTPTSGESVASPDVGRADFTHTIVAGDFLSSIADRYQVEIDDIVGANGWADGREHLLLPGDVIYLPAGAERPAETAVAATNDQDARPASGTVDPSTVCQAGVMADTYQISAGDTLESVAERLGLSVADLRVANTGVTFGEGGSVWVPCRMNWPRFVAFNLLVDPPVCTDMSIQGTYTVQRAGDSDQIGEGLTEIAARLGVTEDQLTTENPNIPFGDLQAGDTIAACTSWFED
jgi:LysM repeat protein